MTEDQILSDEQIIERVLAGDVERFGEIVRRWERRVFALCYGILNSEQDARDAVQETFLAAFRHLANFRGEARVSSWLHRIAFNQCISLQRRARIRQATSLEDETLDHGLQLADGGKRSPAESSEETERSRAVRRAVATLPPELRQVVVMKEFEELTFQEIADALQIPLSTVKSRLYAALKQLRDRLAKHATNTNTASATNNHRQIAAAAPRLAAAQLRVE